MGDAYNDARQRLEELFDQSRHMRGATSLVGGLMNVRYCDLWTLLLAAQPTSAPPPEVTEEEIGLLRLQRDWLRYGLEEIVRGTEPRAGNGHEWEFSIAIKSLLDAGIGSSGSGIQKPETTVLALITASPAPSPMVTEEELELTIKRAHFAFMRTDAGRESDERWSSIARAVLALLRERSKRNSQ